MSKIKEQRELLQKERTSHMPLLLEMFLTFAKIGVSTFGGGYAMLPILQNEIVEKRGWATDEELMDYYAVGQCTPGIIAVNTATFIGYRYAGIIGGILTTLGVIFPSIVIITIIAAFMTNFADLSVVKHAFNGIRACVCVLIFDSVFKLGKKSLKDFRCVIIFLGVLAISLFTPLSPVFLVIAAGVAGFLVMPRKKPGAQLVAETVKEDTDGPEGSEQSHIRMAETGDADQKEVLNVDEQNEGEGEKRV